jgi:hypothetical protein
VPGDQGSRRYPANGGESHFLLDGAPLRQHRQHANTVAPNYSPASAIAHVEAGGVMSKTVFILASAYSGNAVVAFGAGCSISAFSNETDPFCEGDDIAPVHGVRVNAGPCSFVLARHDAPHEADAAVQVWVQAIVGAPDGALLRWDDERQQVVDELAEDLDAFADQVLADFSDRQPLDTQTGPCATEGIEPLE